MSDVPTTGRPKDRPVGSGASRASTGLRAGVATMLIGALLVGVGAIATTSASDEPTCAEGTAALARFDVVDGLYQASGESPVMIDDGTPVGGTWTSTELVSGVIVKGGPGSVLTTVDPAQLAGAFDNSELTPVDGAVPEITSVQFCGPVADPVAPAAARAERPYSVTLAARTCPTYTDIIANRNRNNIQESLEDLGPDTNYGPSGVVNPDMEGAPPQDRCTPLIGWDFQWGTGITGKSPSTANLSTVTGENAIATTTASVPELDAAGFETGGTVEGAVTYTLTEEQLRLATNGRLWIQGGTKSQPLGDETLSFGALRCATDNRNGDNVEYVRYPSYAARHAYCFAYYVAQPPEPVSITVRKQLAEGAAAGTTFEFTGDTSFIPGGTFTLRPKQSGGSDEITFIRAADVAWSVGETVPDGWTLTSLECTAPASGREVVVDGSTFVANLAEGDATVCTFTNDDAPPPSTTTTTESTTTTTEPTTTTTEPTTTTTEPTTTTTEPTTTTSEVSPTSESVPTTGEVSAEEAAQVGGEVVVNTRVTPDDARANSGVLAFTGGSTTAVIVIGIILLILGATLSAVSRQRRQAT